MRLKELFVVIGICVLGLTVLSTFFIALYVIGLGIYLNNYWLVTSGVTYASLYVSVLWYFQRTEIFKRQKEQEVNSFCEQVAAQGCPFCHFPLEFVIPRVHYWNRIDNQLELCELPPSPDSANNSQVIQTDYFGMCQHCRLGMSLNQNGELVHSIELLGEFIEK